MALPRRKILITLVLLAVVCQLIPISRSNPPVTAELETPQELKQILLRSCFDCHSHETIWPWYSRVAPISWLVANDVYEGRRHLNFSTWGEYSPEKQFKLRKKIGESVSEGEMPPFQYFPMHPDAHLSEQDKAMILAWSSTGAGK
jgi:hypothetical protein